MDEEEAELFDLDLRKVNNDKAAKTYMYGVGRYYCELDLISPKDDFQPAFKLSGLNTGHDIRFALKNVMKSSGKTLQGLHT